MFAAIENALVIKLDAQLFMPTAGITTTTHAPDFGMKRLGQAEQALWRQLRRELPDFEIRYCGFLEWTTGEGTRSGGHRRPHVHHLVKGIPKGHPLLDEWCAYCLAEWPCKCDGGDPAQGEERRPTTSLEQRVCELWERYTADAWVCDARPLRTPAGAIAYLTLHHHKREQAPPPTFTGRRLRPSLKTRPGAKVARRGYYELPIDELREAAKDLSRSVGVRDAVRRALAVDLFGEEVGGLELELDVYMSDAIEAALPGFRPAGQTTLLDDDRDGRTRAGEVDDDQVRRQLVDAVLAELQRLREEQPPELVWVREREDIDPDTGQVSYVAVDVLGPVTAPAPRVRRELADRPLPLAVQLRLAEGEAA
jgi:hypothetical protein